MRKWIIMLAGVAAMSAYSPTPSLAQGIGIEVPGVGVRIGEPPRRERARRDELQEREVRSGRNCRTVTVSEDTPTGTRTRSKRECD